MRIFPFNTIPLALFVLAALFVAIRLASAQTDEAPVLPFHELGLFELEAREQEALERHARELRALERARQRLLSRHSEVISHGGRVMDGIIPAEALGIIQINRPHQMTLLHLRGLAGVGSALLRLDDHCVSLPLRFVAGDFGGEGFSARRIDPIRIAVRSQEALEVLLRGDDLVSDMVKVAHGPMSSSASADLVLLDGLTAEHGFVINPGRSAVDDLFGVQGTHVSCPH